MVKDDEHNIKQSSAKIESGSKEESQRMGEMLTFFSQTEKGTFLT